MEFQKILPSDPSIVMFAKIAVNQGRSPGLEKDAFYDAIMKRANDLRLMVRASNRHSQRR
jgi:hypothetical protein